MDVAEPDRTRVVTVNRTRLRLWEWGDPDARAIICVHGAHDHGRMWDGLAPRLTGLGYQVIAPDLRGHGDSGRLSSGHVWASTAVDLALLARLVGPPVGLLGHSFGGGQAMYAAGVWPELARWVVNLDGLGPPAAAFEDRDLCAAAAAGVDSIERVLARPRRPYTTRQEMVDHRGKINFRLPREWVEHAIQHGTVEVEGGFTWKADPMFRTGLPTDFGADHLRGEHELVECPVLVLTGSEHDAWSELTAEEISGRMSHVRHGRHEVIVGAGHYVHVEQPDAVLAAISRFVGEVDG